MKKVLMALAAALMFFVLMVVAFFIIFFLAGDGEMVAEGEVPVSDKELRAIIQQRDSLLANVDSLLVVLAASNAAQDSLGRELAFRDANVNVLEDRLQDKDAVIETLRQVDVNAQAMARTFATMSVPELAPIVAKLGDEVVMDIYKHTTNKRRKFLLSALGDDRAAALTNRLVKRKGSQ